MASGLDVLDCRRFAPGSVIKEAARFLLDQSDSPQLIREIAQAALDDAPIVEALPEGSHAAIGVYRQMLREDPRDAVAALNLAHAYTSAGLADKALHWLNYATALAGESRVVVRARARFFLHMREFDLAHRALLNASCLRGDPWLIATEIAVAELRGKTSRLLGKARRISEDDAFSPMQLSELRAQFAAIEAQSGSMRSAKRILSSVLLDPTENALAQAQFVVGEHHISGISIEESIDNVHDAYEARAYQAFDQGDWETALTNAEKWKMLEPFSSRPSWLAFEIADLGLDDRTLAVQYAKETQERARGDMIATNNLAYALALAGATEAANTVFAAVLDRAVGKVTTGDVAVLFATLGLLAFRSGLVKDGRSNYEKATQYFEQHDKQKLSIALANWSREELLQGNKTEAETLARRAIGFGRAFTDVRVRRTLALLRLRFGVIDFDV